MSYLESNDHYLIADHEWGRNAVSCMRTFLENQKEVYDHGILEIGEVVEGLILGELTRG